MRRNGNWLRGVLLSHPDPLVREHAARCLVAWRDVDGLLTLAADANFAVRKAARPWKN